MTSKELVSVFYSNYNAGIDYAIIDELVFLINEKCLVYDKKIITNKKEFDTFIDKIDSGEINIFDIEGGGRGHLALKLIALRCFKELKVISVENWFQGYRPDLIFRNKKFAIVECGDTNPVKILEYLRSGEVEKVIIITYPSTDDEENIFQHIFTRGAELNEYLDSKVNLLSQKIKKIIKRR